MKVKISYTIDSERIPIVISEMASEVLKKAKELVILCEGLSESGDHGVNSLSKTTTAKMISSDIMETTADMEGVLTGFLANFSPRPQATEEQERKMGEVLERVGELSKSVKGLEENADA